MSESAFAQIHPWLPAGSGGGRGLEGPQAAKWTRDAFHVPVSRSLSGFVTVNAAFALLSGSNEH